MLRSLRVFVTPPVFDSEEQTRNVRLSHILILATIGLNLLSILVDYIFIPFTPNIELNLFILGVQVVLLIFVRRGYYRKVGIAFTVITWLAITYTAFNIDGLSNPIIVLYVVPILISGLLINLWSGLSVAGLSILSIIGFALAATTGAYPLLTTSIPMGMRLGYYVVLFGFTGVALYLGLGTLRSILERTRAAENQLRENNQRLKAESEARVAIQRELEDGERRWRFALEGSDTGVWDMDVETGEVYRSVRYLELIGYTADEIANMPDTSLLFHPEDREQVMQKRDRYLKEQAHLHEAAPYEDKIRLLHGDGTYHWYLYRGKITYFNADNLPKRFMGTLTDITRQQQMETALEEAEFRWRFALEGSDAGVWDLDVDGSGIYRSPRYLALLGYTADNMPPFTSLIHPDEFDQSIVKRDQFLSGKISVYQDEYRLMCADNVYRWFSSKGKIIERKPDGTARRIVGTLTDITPHKQMEETIRVSEEAYRRLFENNPNPMWVYNATTAKIVAVNDAAMHLYGYSQNEFFGMTYWNLVAANELNRLKALVDTGIDHFSAPDLWLHKTKDSRIIQVEVSAHETVFQEQPCRVVLIRDLTAQKETEESLRTSQELFSRVFDNVPVGVSLSRLEDGQYFSVNPYLAEMLDYTPADMVGHTSIDLKIIDSAARAKHVASIRKHAPDSFKTEQKFKTRTGRNLDVLSSNQVIRLADEDALLAIIVDITSIKRAERERMQIEMLQSELDNQREVIELKERFISGVSHEFRSPLTIMLTGTGILRLHDTKFTSEQRIERLEKIETQIHYLSDLLDRVLTISKARAGKFQFNPRPLDIVRFCRELFEDFRLTDNDKHVFVFEAAGDFDNAHMDEKLLQHILMNLVSNAVKYSPEGKRVRMRLERNDNDVVIEVVDEGIGIPEDEQNQVFEPFFRSKNAENFKGTGLGLSITKESVDAHLGHISWQSQPGVGTTFTVRLPGKFNRNQMLQIS